MAGPDARQKWKVVGGSSGGIIVREGRELSSALCAGRLENGAVIEELALSGDRLNFNRLSGNGPDTGWVSTSVKGKALIAKEGQDLVAFDDYKSEIDKLRDVYKNTVEIARRFREDEWDDKQDAKDLLENEDADATAFSKWRCVFRPKVALRASPSTTSQICGVARYGEVIEVDGEPTEEGWVKLKAGEYALLQHESLGVLLEYVEGGSAMARAVARRGARKHRMDESWKAHDALLEKCGISGGSNHTPSSALEQIIQKMREAERKLKGLVGQAEARKFVTKLAASPEITLSKDEMYCVDRMGTGRGTCERCGTCPCYKWVFEDREPGKLRCDLCECDNHAHKEIGVNMGKPGFRPDMTDDQIEHLNDIFYRLEQASSWN